MEKAEDNIPENKHCRDAVNVGIVESSELKMIKELWKQLAAWIALFEK